MELFTWLISCGQSTLVKKSWIPVFLPRFEDERWWSSTLHGAASSFCLMKKKIWWKINVWTLMINYVDLCDWWGWCFIQFSKWCIIALITRMMTPFCIQKAWTKNYLATKALFTDRCTWQNFRPRLLVLYAVTQYAQYLFVWFSTSSIWQISQENFLVLQRDFGILLSSHFNCFKWWHH